MISRTFFRSSLIYTFVGALPYISGFILLFWFTGRLTPEQFGINALYIGLMYFVQILSMVGWDLSVGVLYFDYKNNSKKLNEFIGTVFTGLLILGFIWGVVFFVGGFNLFQFTFSGGNYLELIPFGMITIISGICNGIFKSYTALLINMQRPLIFFYLNFINFIITIGTSLLLLYLFPYTLYGPVIGRFIPSILLACVSLFLVYNQFELRLYTKYLKKLFSYSTPLLISALLIWIISYIDRFIILRLMDDPISVGIYDFAVKITTGIELIIMGIINSITPKIYSIWKDRHLNHSTPEVNRYYYGLTAIILLVIPLFLFLVPLIIPVVVHKPIYYQAFRYLPLMAGGFAVRVWFYMFLAPVMFFKRTRVMPLVSFISAGFQVGIGILLIHYMGIWGAVVTGIIIKFIQAALLYNGSRKVFHYKFNRWKIVYLPIIFIGIILLSQFFINDSNSIYIHACQMFISLFLVWFVYRKELSNLLPRILKFSSQQ